MLDLGHGEYAMLAHLRRGSVAVEAGQQVAAGDELGRCGNSGNTSEPPLHLHLQDAPKFGEGNGLPVFFEHRSEEHTSELQSLMRTSYAVFCLKTKNAQSSTATQ